MISVENISVPKSFLTSKEVMTQFETTPNKVDVNFSKDSIRKESTNILLIGMTFNRAIVKQMSDQNLTSLCEIVDKKGKKLEQSIIRDTWRCNEIKKQFSNVTVHTCSILSDDMRHINDKTNLNYSCNTN